MKHMRPLLALLLVSTGGTFAADEGAFVPADAYGRLVARSAAVIQEALKEETPNRRAADRARVLALILAEAAQQDLTAERVALRDTTLEIARLVRGQEFAQARRLAGMLTKLGPGVTSKKERVKLVGVHLEMDEVMSVFRKSTLGGLGIESELDRLENESEHQMVAAAELTETLELFAYQAALAAELVKDHRPDKNAAEWQKRCAIMRQNALTLALAVRAKDGKAAFRAVADGNANCTACHKAFR